MTDSLEVDLGPIDTTILSARLSTRRVTVTFTRNGNPLDITGMTVVLTVKKKASQADVEIFSTDGVLSNPSQGEAVLSIPKAETFGTDGKETTFQHEIRLIDGTDQFVVFAGDFIVQSTAAPNPDIP